MSPPTEHPDAVAPPDDPEAVVQELLSRPPVALKLIEAARGCVLDRGISRVTMSDVARRADVSRTTLYRHYPDVETVLRDLLTLEFGQLVLRADATAAARATARERLVGTLIEGCRELRADGFFRKILDVDPEFLLPYVTARRGVSQRLVTTVLRAGIVAGQEDGSIRLGDPTNLARLLLVQAQALVISVGIVTGGDADVEDEILALAEEALNAQLRPLPED